MHNYRIDFAMNRGHEMTIDRVNGIFRHELDEIELNMLQSQQVPYMLPVDWFDLDGKVTFRYSLTGMKMLVHRLQQQPITMEQYYVLLLGVTDALNECKHYMLRPEGCLLEESFIFIGEQLQDIRLVYLPVKGKEGGQPIGNGDLLSLIVRFTSYVENINGEGLKRILQHVNDNKWPLAELRSTLLELIGTQPEIEAIRPKQQPSAHSQQLSELPYKPIKPITADVDAPQSVSASYMNLPYDDEEDQDEADTGNKRKWIYTSAIIVAIAAVWRFMYMASSTRQSMLISAAITLLLLAVLLLVWRNRASEMALSVESQFELEEFLPISAPLAKMDKWNDEKVEKELVPKVAGNYSRQPYLSDSTLHNSGVSAIAAGQEKSHVPLVEPTVFLGHSSQQEQTDKPIIWLQRSWGGNQSKIELAHPIFKIGRAGEQVAYEESAEGVSRIHLEIEHINGEYRAKDLGSRNGSLLNGQAMIPYKSYKLVAGDAIHLAGVNGPAYELKVS